MTLLRNLIDQNKAGSPTDSSVYWVHLKPKEIALLFEKQYHIKVSTQMVKRVLKSLGYRYRKLSKSLATGVCEQRNEQFEIICNLILSLELHTPILSIDCKKKEKLGNLYRDGKCYSTNPVKVFDHDYNHLSKGKIIPHGIYDLHRNEGYISIGNSSETAEFITDNLLWWWENFGIHHYWNAKNILILCDAGGGNSYRHHAFKKQLLKLARTIGKDIIICHYPPYSSKYNPIEHRLFCHIHRTMQGIVLSNYQLVQELISKTSTKTGLKVHVRLNLKNYPTGIKTHRNEVDFQRIQFNQKISKFSYRIAS